MPELRQTACILCSRNCGITVEVDNGHLTRIRGDRQNPVSEGYLCQKAARLDYYQNHADRLDTPLRRREDGSFEPVSWEVAIAEIAARLVAIRERRGGRAFAYYGGGGQGNHLGGVYGTSLLRAMGSQYYYSALAQEKTGDFWVNGRLFGRQTCHTTEDIDHAEVALFVGTNPWEAHGIRNARNALREISRDPARTMIVIDPRRTETAALADVHLQLRPGTDAFLLAAILALIVRQGLQDRAFLETRTVGFDQLDDALKSVDVARYVERAGVPLADVERVARTLAGATAAAVRVDLGIQQSLHSTLNSYLEKLLFLVTGNLGRRGGNNFHTFLLPLIGHSDAPGPDSSTWRTVVTGMPAISKLFPPNVLPAEIDNDRPDRIRAMVVDSANPLRSGADTGAYESALARLELLVTIDVAMSETARASHYVLPASSQFEKWEATFFNLEFPTNAFHLRAPILPPRPGTLAEPEIYRRLLVAMGELPQRFPLLERVARLDRRWPALRLLELALGARLKLAPKLTRYAPFVLQETLGAALPDGARAAAPLWFGAQRYARRHADAVRRTGLSGSGSRLGERLFERILTSRAGCLISRHEYDDTWKFIRHADGKVHLAIPELLDELRALTDEAAPDETFPFVLVAGERRAYNANTIYRDRRWRKTDPEGALRIHPRDAESLVLKDGTEALCESARASLRVRVQHDESIRPGVVTLPHGYGLELVDGDGGRAVLGPVINRLTSAERRDPISATPYHKYVPVRLAPARREAHSPARRRSAGP